MEAMKDNLYTYRMLITKVYDGDSLIADCDLGFKSSMHDLVLRVNRLDTPEVRRSSSKGIDDLHVEAGKKVRDWLADLILNKWVTVQTFKDKNEKYGRFLAEIYVDGKNINDLMVEKGFAKKYYGGTKQKFTDKQLEQIIKDLS